MIRSPLVLVVGLTGGIGAGKSTVSGLLAERGAVVVDADLISRQVVEPDGPAYQGVVDRFQLFRALQMQDRLPGVRLGECAAALGYAPILAVEKLYTQYAQLRVVEVDTEQNKPAPEA